MSTPRPSPRWFAPSSIPPILLLTAVTSFAFNHALISTQRKQDLRDHRIRVALLTDTIGYNSRLLHHLNPPSKSNSSWFGTRTPKQREVVEEEWAKGEWAKEERAVLMRRWRALGTDPVREKLLPQSRQGESVEGAERVLEGGVGEGKRLGPKEVTWSEIFLGSKEKRSSLTERWKKVTAGIKDSFTLNTNSTPPETRTTEEEEKELEQLSKLWSSATKEQ
ncbi:hypothetical protein NDA11_003128 [Ustilago hordei]|uniref:Uncharacterized protein n=1 Tax=Ustilago hordei TaxID=120017 RepID=I2FVJ2_USTHO|nr:uncharacterized protein UHO2_04467 [Ustilago hordei]KAJ1042414.1 hypothetical protein NDA10_003327 [Ustilago hordei]KAJ1578029.1 hypothetical protein NDA12_002217 [Ustilago hordei]KAJ1578313.1 hypothetical protein NDA11_003128 [Ustilago hordei]KAJ1592559.1 hypothetical protein NDA15_005913 [Ustilago hordei]KAJ1595728.1 hypothetical protein NDA14_001336 [Ustilago hordei]